MRWGQTRRNLRKHRSPGYSGGIATQQANTARKPAVAAAREVSQGPDQVGRAGNRERRAPVSRGDTAAASTPSPLITCHLEAGDPARRAPVSRGIKPRGRSAEVVTRRASPDEQVSRSAAEMHPSHCALLLVLLVSAAAGTRNPSNVRLQACGPNLTQLLSTVCGGNYYRPNKKSQEGSPADDGSLLWSLIGAQDSEDRLIQPFPRGPLRRVTRQVGGVASECCYKSCTLRELSEYCAD
ncbi:uncharacterized protein LOC134536489 [Bacillus rossius redtenbacheri]|uniref:uncharacterized protein LOC134536489 n=1 Tax=Bacillus rossius redtenbacheri TaxID=93214 RepID=UPI002FDE6A3C